MALLGLTACFCYRRGKQQAVGQQQQQMALDVAADNTPTPFQSPAQESKSPTTTLYKAAQVVYIDQHDVSPQEIDSQRANVRRSELGTH